MKDQEEKAERITVAEAFRRVEEAIEKSSSEQRFPDKKSINVTTRLYDPLTELGPRPPPAPASYSVESGKTIAITQIEHSFTAFCSKENVIPRSLHNPWGAEPYTGDAYQKLSYDIALSEYERWAEPYFQKTIPWQNPRAADKDKQDEAAARSIGPEEHAPKTHEETISDLFDPVTVETLEKMFPSGKWEDWSERAARNGLKDAREGRGMFNPYRAGLFFINQGIAGWDLARVYRVLSSNLPVRSAHEKHRLTGHYD